MGISFVVLPFADVESPAIGVSLLHTRLIEMGIRSTILYMNIDLAEWIGADLYGWIAERGDQHVGDSWTPGVSLLGEWFFADTVFDSIASEEDYIARFLVTQASSRLRIPEILEARNIRNRFVDHCVAEIQRSSPRIVGFTTTFHQTCACLSVARRLKDTPDSPIIMFGGANCEGVMGMQLLASFPWIDYVCTGEGDLVVPSFIEHLLKEGEGETVPGILRQCGGVQALSSPPLVVNMDELPIPDYSHYFDRVCRSPLMERLRIRLTMETSRGCWWGEKQHCTFCGLNGASMGFRSKSPSRVIRELRHQTKKYATRRLDMVDNILDMKYFQTLFPALMEVGPAAEVFWETKANLRFEQLQLLRSAGICSIQAGIESLSNEVLRLMRKGCTGLTNIQLLRWAEELDIHVGWNLIFGFPGEPPFEYLRMAKVLPLLAHLQPPTFCLPIRMDRFSPLYVIQEKAGAERHRPMPAYSYVFPVNNKALKNLAYFFEFDYCDCREPASYAFPVIQAAAHWVAEARAGARLDLFHTRDLALITDTRRCATTSTHVLTGVAAQVCLACDSSQTASGLARTLEISEAQAHTYLEQLIDTKLMVEMEGRYLSLPVIRAKDGIARNARAPQHPRRCSPPSN